MKIRRCAAILVLVWQSGLVFSQTNFSSQVSQMWLDGQKQDVLDIASQRLAVNSNDMAGLLLKLAYEVEFLCDDDLTNTMSRVEQVGSAIATTNFAAIFPRIQDDMDTMREMMSLTPLSPTELQSEKAKGDISGKPLMYEDALIALEQDGLLE